MLAIVLPDRQVAAALTLDLGNLEQVEAAILDNPAELSNWVMQKAASGEILSPVHAVRLTRLKFTHWDEKSNGLPTPEELDQALATAKQLNLHSDYIDLFLFKITEEFRAGLLPSDAGLEAAHRQLVALASDLPGPLWRARTLVHLSSFLYERGRIAEALNAIQESYQITADLKDVPPILTLPVLLHLSTMLNATGQQDKAFVIFQEIQTICDLLHLRFAAQRNLYSIGKHYAFEGPSRNLDLAASYTQRSLALAEELGMPWEIAVVHTSLISIERRRQRYADALEHARTALPLFEKAGDPIWTAEVQTQWAEVLIAEKNYAAALPHLDKAAKLFPVHYKRDQAQLLELRSRVLKGLGQHAKALELFEKFHALDKELARDREQDIYARSKASLGLQIEEERNKALSAEKALTEQKLKTAQLYTFIGLMAVISVIALGFLTIRLQRENKKINELQDYIHRGVLLRFLPPMIVDEIISGRSRLESEPKEERVTVIFADIVNFTQLTERLGVNHIASILNRFLQTMTDVIFAENGTIDKFIGDAVMVLYGAPSPLRAEDQAEKAVQCAVAMLKAVDQLSTELLQEYGTTLNIRIGIHQDRAIVGTFGGMRRSDYTAVGPAVNLASRIEAKAQPHEILLSQDVADLLPPWRVHNRGLHTIKGYDQEIQLFAWIPDEHSQAAS